MAKKPQLEVTFFPEDGKFKATVKNVPGRSCVSTMKEVEKILGSSISVKDSGNTNDIYQKVDENFMPARIGRG